MYKVPAEAEDQLQDHLQRWRTLVKVEDPDAQTLSPPVFQRCASGLVSVVTLADLGLPHAAAPPARLVFTALRRTTAVLELS